MTSVEVNATCHSHNAPQTDLVSGIGFVRGTNSDLAKVPAATVTNELMHTTGDACACSTAACACSTAACACPTAAYACSTADRTS